MKILLQIRYDGTDFHGYQVQQNARTVQGEFNLACLKLFGCECDVTGCSRTDSGVHALSFWLTVSRRDGKAITIPTDRIPTAFNSVLPSDISVTYAKKVEDLFHPRYDVKEKEYLYLINTNEIQDPFLRNYSYHLSRSITPNQIDNMNKAASFLVGEHDFASFMSEGSNVQSTVRTIYKAEFVLNDKMLEFRISANGFLYNMVRIIVGTLLDIGIKNKSPDEIKTILKKKNRSFAASTAPAQGLYLSRVEY